MPRPVHFEIHADEPDRAMAFYRSVMGWQFTSWSGPWPYWMISTGDKSEPGIDGGLLQRRGGAPGDHAAVNAFVCTVGVDDLDACLAKAIPAGATLAVERMPIPGVGYLAYIKDTEGNIVGLMQPDMSAK